MRHWYLHSIDFPLRRLFGAEEAPAGCRIGWSSGTSWPERLDRSWLHSTLVQLGYKPRWPTQLSGRDFQWGPHQAGFFEGQVALLWPIPKCQGASEYSPMAVEDSPMAVEDSPGLLRWSSWGCPASLKGSKSRKSESFQRQTVTTDSQAL